MVLVQKVEILRRRPRWPSVRFLRPNSLKKHDIKIVSEYDQEIPQSQTFNFDFLSMFRGLIIQAIKMKHSQV